MRLRHVCAIVAGNAVLGAAAFTGCATGSNGFGGAGGSGPSGPGVVSSTSTTSTTASTTTSVSSTASSGTGGSGVTGTGGQSASGTGGVASGTGGATSTTTSTTSTTSSGGNPCFHSVCKKGVPLDPACDPCAQAVCSNDTYCCDPNGMWDAMCVNSDVPTYCAAMTCTADAGAPDAGMDASTMDAGTMDAGAMDASATDASTMDASTVDAGSVDAGPCETTHLVISQIRTRGVGGAGDEFIELYNPSAAAVTLDGTWKIMGRSTGSASYTARWTGNGGIIVAHGYYLMTGSTYTQQPARDQALAAGITDAASLVLSQGGAQIDAVCYAFDTATTTAVGAFTCEGTPVSNLPHNNGTAGTSNSDASIQRLPGGNSGSCIDTDDNAADFIATAPAVPHSTASAPAP